MLDAHCCLSSSFLYTFSDVCLVVRAYVCTVLQQTTFIYRQVLLIHCTALTTNYETVKCTGVSPFARVLRIDCCLDSCSNILDFNNCKCMYSCFAHPCVGPHTDYVIYYLETWDVGYLAQELVDDLSAHIHGFGLTLDIYVIPMPHLV